MFKTTPLGIHLNQIHRHMCDIRVDKMYGLWRPRAPMTTWKRRCMEAIKRCTPRWEVFCHSRCSAVRTCGSVWDGRFFLRTSWSSLSHRCSVGFKSGEGNVWTLWCCRTFSINTCDMWSGIVMLKHSIFDVWCCRTSSRYPMPVSAPAICTKAVLRPWWISAHTMTLPPPKRSPCCTQFGV